jgi:hypothetical protein
VDVATGINRHFPAVCNIVEHDASSTEQPLPSAVFPIKINGRRFHALLDSGASISSIKFSVAEKLGVRLRPSNVQQASGITGHVIELLGRGKFDVHIGRKKLYHQSIHMIGSCPHDLIVGMDLLHQVGSVTLDFYHDRMYLSTNSSGRGADYVPTEVPARSEDRSEDRPVTWRAWMCNLLCCAIVRGTQEPLEAKEPLESLEPAIQSDEIACVLSIHTTASATTVPPCMKYCDMTWNDLRHEYNVDPNFWENVEELIDDNSDDYDEEFALVREHVALWEAQDKIKASNQ